jgi:cholesterol transport system auxiliary component
MKLSLTWISIWVGLLFFCLGCNQAENHRYFLLGVQRDGNPQTLSHKSILTVRPFSLSPGYHPKELTYRTGDFQYETDYYNRFITDVGRQIAEQTRRWLADAGLFANVVPPGSTMRATHLLEGNVTRLYGDFRDKTNAQAVVEVTFYLLDITNRDPKILFHETFHITTAVPENKVELLIEAYNAGLSKILEQFEGKLAQSLPFLEAK